MIRSILLMAVVFAAPGLLAAAEPVSFKDQLVPVLTRRCLGCHNNRKTEGRYALHTFEQLLRAGDSGEKPIVAGEPETSLLFQKLIDPDAATRMPQEDEPLNAAEIALFRTWIEQGAKFDGSAAGDRLVTLLPPRKHPQPPEKYRRPVATFALRFSPDGKSLLTAGVHEVLVWEVETGALLRRIANMPQRIHALRFSPDEQTLVVAGGAPGEYGEIRLVTWASGQVRTLPAWEDVVLDVTFSRDGKRLIAGGADNSVRGYDVATSRELWRNQQHVDWVTALDVTDYQFAEELVANEGSPAGFQFNEHERATGSHPRQHWQFPDDHYIVRKANWELEAAGSEVIALTKITITGIGKTYKETRERIKGDMATSHAAIVAALQKLHDDWGRTVPGTPFVLSASRDRTVKVFGLQDGALFTTYKGHRREYGPLAGLHRVFGVQAEPGTRRVWSGGEGRHFHGWNPLTVRDEDGTAADMEARFAKEYSIDVLRHDLPEAVFALVRSGPQLFAASATGHVQGFFIAGDKAKFDLGQAAPKQEFVGLSDPLFALDAHTSTGRIAAAGFRGEVAIWSTNSPDRVIRFKASP